MIALRAELQPYVSPEFLGDDGTRLATGLALRPPTSAGPISGLRAWLYRADWKFSRAQRAHHLREVIMRVRSIEDQLTTAPNTLERASRR
ncbi:MAG: hypothetical protein ACPHRO_08445 [Nannocystaceae bacterium]